MWHEHKRHSTYRRVVEFLNDGQWHHVQELKHVSTFPEEWVNELTREGLEVKETEGGTRLVRLAATA